MPQVSRLAALLNLGPVSDRTHIQVPADSGARDVLLLVNQGGRPIRSGIDGLPHRLTGR